MADVKIVMTGHGRGELFVDGVKVDKVRKIEFSAEPECTNEVRVTIIPETVEIEGPADVVSSSASDERLSPWGRFKRWWNTLLDDGANEWHMRARVATGYRPGKDRRG